MDNIIISFNVVFPILVMLGIGYILRRINLMSEETANQVNKISFKILLPCMLFKNVYDSEISAGFNVNLIWWSLGFITCVFILLCLIVPRFIKDKSKASVFIQGCFRSNFVIYGVPITISLLGETNAGVVAVLIAVVIPLYNFLAILDFQLFGKTKLNFGRFLLGLIKNPLIISSLIGLVFLWLRVNSNTYFGFEFELPTAIYDAINNLGKIATPISFLVLGATLKFASIKKDISLLTSALVMRLAVLPALGIAITYFLGFRGVDFVALMVLFSTPNAVSSFTMAQELGGDADLAGEIVVFTSAFSIISMFLIIFTCKQLCLF